MEEKPELAYYLTLYKIVGHETWRASLKSAKDGLDKERANQKKGGGGKVPKITEMNVIRINRITGTIKPV